MFRKILPILLILCFIAVPATATVHYIDMSLSSGADDGTSQADAWNNLCDSSKGLIYAVSDGDVIFVRRATGGETQSASCSIIADAQANNPHYVIGWPRDAIPDTTITQATWTNGDATVDSIVGLSMDREKHVGRWATAPDGFDYLITFITDSDTIEIDRPYVGTTVTTTDGKFAIKADDLPPGISEPADPQSWSNDADDLAYIDFDGNAQNLALNVANHWVFYNLHIGNSLNANGAFFINNSMKTTIKGCLFTAADNSSEIVRMAWTQIYMDRVIFDGSGTGAAQNCIETSNAAVIDIVNSAIYGCGNYGIHGGLANIYYHNVNVGVEQDNTNDDLYIPYGSTGTARDLMLGGANGDIVVAYIYSRPPALISVNHNKVLGASYIKYGIDYVVEKAAVSGEPPDKKLSDNVLRLTVSLSSTTYALKEFELWPRIFEMRRNMSVAGTYDIRLYLYNDLDTSNKTLNDTTATDDIAMRCRAEVVSYGDAATEYNIGKWLYSDEIDIEPAASASDWDYLQVDSVVVDKANTKVICQVITRVYDSNAEYIYLDPQYEDQ